MENHRFVETDSKGRTKLVKFEGLSYYKYLCKAKWWVFNSNTRYFVKPTKEQVYVQTWHGTPLKKIGLDVLLEGSALTDKNEKTRIYNDEAKKLSYMIAPSEYTKEKLISAFNLKAYNKQEKVLTFGYPRNDKLSACKTEDIINIKNRLKISLDKKVLLYAPTFRDNKYNVSKGFTLEHKFDFEKFYETFADRYVILFRSHYFISEKLDKSAMKNVIDVSKEDDITDILLVSDLLITDYSSVLFDYANLKRPMIFYMYDIDEYKNSVRDFYIDTNTLPGPVCKDFDKVLKEIEEWEEADGSKDFINEKYIDFYERFCSIDNGDSAEKICKTVFKI